ncbi:unnamed protein product, partial [Larinioides sclopetarius]
MEVTALYLNLSNFPLQNFDFRFQCFHMRLFLSIEFIIRSYFEFHQFSFFKTLNESIFTFHNFHF